MYIAYLIVFSDYFRVLSGPQPRSKLARRNRACSNLEVNLRGPMFGLIQVIMRRQNRKIKFVFKALQNRVSGWF